MKQKNNKEDDLMLCWNDFLSGDEGALSKIFEQTYRNLFSFGTTLTHDTELVKDCIQDVFVWLLQKRTLVASVKNIKVYLLYALKNTLLDAFKKQHAYRSFIDKYNPEDSVEISEEEQIITQESDRALQHLIAKYTSTLTTRQQEILHYRFVDDLSIEEIATLLGINYQSVANTIQRSLQKIRNLFLKTEYKN